MKTDDLTQSLEDYLEAIYSLEEKNRVARVKEIADLLDVKMPSVTSAIKQLKEKNLIDYEKNSFITLTPHGKELAKIVDQKHHILANFLVDILKNDKTEATQIACQIEHIIDLNTALKLKKIGTFLIEKHKDFVKSEDWKSYLESE